jgi:DNA-binding transcriptional LysR family regulator
VAELRSEKFISREHGSGTLDSFGQLLVKGRRSLDKLLDVSMELGSTEAVKEALRGGFGISILSRISIQHELAEGSIVEVPIRGLTMERDFYEVSHKHRPLHPIAQAFREFLKRS